LLIFFCFFDKGFLIFELFQVIKGFFMSKINDLINKLCPDGVEYRELGSIALITIGEFVHKNKQSNNGKYPVYNGGITNTGFYSDFNNKANKILISARGANAGFVNRILVDYWAGNSCYSISIKNKDLINWNFVYYFLKHNQIKLTAEQQIGSIPAVSKKTIENFLVPIPPLPIQEEIVRILDAFTELITLLKTELEARKKQYEYYRNKLLNFEGKDVEWKTLGEVFNIKNGYTPSKSKSEYWTDGTIPWFRMEDIRTNGRVLKDSIQHVNKLAVKGNKVFPKNSIIVATSATIGEHALVLIPHLANQRFVSLSTKIEYKHRIDIKFIFYYFFILDEWCMNNTTTSSFSSVDMKGFRNFNIPIPSLTEQQRIADILDKFDTLVNDLAAGIPAEIEARRKQYEYYRNKLLTFKEVTRDA
jgi:type I restriction enzyme S subunit